MRTPLFLLLLAPLHASTIWTGPTVLFTKTDGLASGNPGGTDFLTPAVSLTRGLTQGLFNASAELNYSNSSPAGTAWAFGTTADLETLAFSSWFTWVNRNPPGTVGRDAVLHLIEEDIYLDITFLSWSNGFAVPENPGFSYQRSSPVPEPSTPLIGSFTLALYLTFSRRRPRS